MTSPDSVTVGIQVGDTTFVAQVDPALLIRAKTKDFDAQKWLAEYEENRAVLDSDQDRYYEVRRMAYALDAALDRLNEFPSLSTEVQVVSAAFERVKAELFEVAARHDAFYEHMLGSPGRLTEMIPTWITRKEEVA